MLPVSARWGGGGHAEKVILQNETHKITNTAPASSLLIHEGSSGPGESPGVLGDSGIKPQHKILNGE